MLCHVRLAPPCFLRFSTTSCPRCASGCPCMSLTTVAFTTVSSCSRNSSRSSPRLQLPLPPPPVLPSAAPPRPPAVAPAITATARLTGSRREQRQQVRTGSSASPQSCSSSTRRWSCARTSSSPSLDTRRSGVTGQF